VSAMSATHSISYQLYLDTSGSDNQFFIYWQVTPWAIGDSDYVAIYESMADLEADFQRVAEGKSPDNQKSYEWVKDLPSRQWQTKYDVESGWLAAYWSKNYVFDQYICITWTPAW
jgi:hypothetical protein